MKGNPIKYFNDLYDARIKSMQGGGGDYATPDEWVDSGYPGSGREKRKIKRKKRRKEREVKRNKRKGTTVDTAKPVRRHTPVSSLYFGGRDEGPTGPKAP